MTPDLTPVGIFVFWRVAEHRIRQEPDRRKNHLILAARARDKANRVRMSFCTGTAPASLPAAVRRPPGLAAEQSGRRLHFLAFHLLDDLGELGVRGCGHA